ncbi:MAG: hypothetical protein HJJLKODD_00531 [Phycisphaerae bacterium]|nr:hypothetical protein [Phycisphaerae bacterium]
MVGGFLISGCGDQTTQPLPFTCGTATIAATSADANNQFTQLETQQCDISLQGGVLTIDLLDREAGTTIVPRVLFTLEVGLADIPDDETIDLARSDDLEPRPAIYMDYVLNSDPAEGNFWTSSTGEITFQRQADDSITAEFEFDADNPVSLGNEAVGTIRVTGEVIVQAAPTPTTNGSACGLGMAPVGIAVSLWWFVSLRRQFHGQTRLRTPVGYWYRFTEPRP